MDIAFAPGATRIHQRLIMDAQRPAAVNEANASEGGCGAPPEPSRSNQAPAGLTREYHTDRISVLWFAERCIHSGECIRALPRVFNPRRRPWVDLTRAEADAIAEAVLLCPTGALHYVRHDGGAQEPEPGAVQVRAVRDAYLVQGRLEIHGADGELIRSDTRMALCRCGCSAQMPFCDNTHRSIGFREPGRRES